MLLINISTDKVHVADGRREELLPRNGIEDAFGPLLIDRYKKDPFQEIFLINGPGGFTNLRVGTLMLNMLNAVTNKNIQIYSTDKLTLYAWLVKKGVLPHVGAIYLGQRINVRLANFSQKKMLTSECKVTDIPADVFLDEVHDPYRPHGNAHMLHFTNETGKIYVTYKDKKCEVRPADLKLRPGIQVQPEYMMEPVLN